MAIYAVSCDNCKSTVTVRCECGPAGHRGDCPAGNFDTALQCRPGAPCCGENHDHGAAANACPGAGLNHPGADCPAPSPADCLAVTPEGVDCPGGHCGVGVGGCTVCRPITITVLDIGAPVGGTS